MVGLSPFSNPNSTITIPTQIVPLILLMADGGVFNPTAPDPCAAAPLKGTSDLVLFQQSPIFLNHAYTMNGVTLGPTQYVDAFQQANFWSLVSGQSYHTVLSATTLNPITIRVGANVGRTVPPGTSGRCGNIGLIDLDAFDNFVQGTLIPLVAGQGVNPTTLPIFLLGNVVLTENGFADCCILGYHSAFGSPTQTYSVSDFDTTGAFRGVADTSILAHVVAEWMDDPLGTNPTPPWGGLGQVADCQDNLEVGDPLSGT